MMSLTLARREHTSFASIRLSNDLLGRRWLDFGTTEYAKPHWMKDEPKIPAKRSRSQRAMIHYHEETAGSPTFSHEKCVFRMWEEFTNLFIFLWRYVFI